LSGITLDLRKRNSEREIEPDPLSFVFFPSGRYIEGNPVFGGNDFAAYIITVLIAILNFLLWGTNFTFLLGGIVDFSRRKFFSFLLCIILK